MMGEWQSIDTAPQDGTEFLGFFPASESGLDRDVLAVVAFSYCALLRRMAVLHELRTNSYFDPTHWMPLPAPPQTRHETEAS